MEVKIRLESFENKLNTVIRVERYILVSLLLFTWVGKAVGFLRYVLVLLAYLHWSDIPKSLFEGPPFWVFFALGLPAVYGHLVQGFANLSWVPLVIIALVCLGSQKFSLEFKPLAIPIAIRAVASGVLLALILNTFCANYPIWEDNFVEATVLLTHYYLTWALCTFYVLYFIFDAIRARRG